MKYPYIDDPEPKELPETKEDKFIRVSGKVFNITVTIIAIAFAVMAVCGIIIRHI